MNFGVYDFSRLTVTDWRLRRWRLWFLALSNAFLTLNYVFESFIFVVLSLKSFLRSKILIQMKRLFQRVLQSQGTEKHLFSIFSLRVIISLKLKLFCSINLKVSVFLLLSGQSSPLRLSVPSYIFPNHNFPLPSFLFKGPFYI